MLNKTFKKNSENAKAVARDVINLVRKGQKIVMGKIIRSHGYSISVSRKPSKVTRTISYCEIIWEEENLIKKELVEILDCMKKKQGKASLRDLAVAFKSLQNCLFALEDRALHQLSDDTLREEDRRRLSKLLSLNLRPTSP